MIQSLARFTKHFYLQIVLFLFINGLFIYKYFPRVGLNSTLILAVYCIFVLLIVYLYKTYSTKISEKIFKISFWVLFGFITLVIISLLIGIDKYAVRVDRWSAVTFFLDNLFQGKYPYSAHTHLSLTNFASPFPVWHFINIPFYLMGDVGIGLVFFLFLTVIAVRYFFGTYQKSFFFLLLLFISPAYWWEVAVRSDSLSNALLVFVFILWFNRKNYSLTKNLWLCIIACGLIASTRLTAILPLALFFFKPFIEISWKQKTVFLSGVLGIVFLSFSPFIFWDTSHWIFFTRNPFLTQTSVGNPYLLLMLIILGSFAAFRWNNIAQYLRVTSLFIFIFVVSSQLGLIFTKGIHGSIFTDSLYDISYFSLSLPYCMAFITNSMFQKPKEYV